MATDLGNRAGPYNHLSYDYLSTHACRLSHRTVAPPLERLDLSRTQLQPMMAPIFVGAALGSVMQCIIAGNSLGDTATEGIAQVLEGRYSRGDQFSLMHALTDMQTC